MENNQPCSHCGQLTDNWRWRLGEAQPPSYLILCSACCRRQDAEFTADQAILQAEIVIAIRVGVLNARVAK